MLSPLIENYASLVLSKEKSNHTFFTKKKKTITPTHN